MSMLMSLKGGVLRGKEEVDAIRALHEHFPKARVTLVLWCRRHAFQKA
jgi:hypothetical protein